MKNIKPAARPAALVRPQHFFDPVMLLGLDDGLIFSPRLTIRTAVRQGRISANVHVLIRGLDKEPDLTSPLSAVPAKCQPPWEDPWFLRATNAIIECVTRQVRPPRGPRVLMIEGPDD